MTEKNNNISWLPTALNFTIPVFITIVLFVASILLITVPVVNNTIIQDNRQKLKDLTDVASSILEYNDNKVKTHLLTETEAKAESIRMFRALRYGNDGADYFWLMDSSATMIMHPLRKDIDGTYVYEFQDVNGKYLFKEMLRISLDSGQGYIDYHWKNKFSSGTNQPKFAHVVLFKPWGWIIGTGENLSDVYSTIDDIVANLYLIFGIVLILFIIISIYIIRQAARIEKNREDAVSTLKESEEKYRAVYWYANDSIMLFYDGEIIDCNEKTLEMFEVEREQIIGHRFSEFLPHEQIDGELSIDIIKDKSDLAISTSQAIIFEAKAQKFNGRIFDVEVTFKSAHINNELHLFGIIRDITDVKKEQNRQAELNHELELRVKQRTLELEMAYTELKEFTYIASHDLKTPLHGISQPIQWLKNDYTHLFDNEANELMAIIIERVRKMDRNINGIIRYLKAGRFSYKIEMLDVKELIEKILGQIKTDKKIEYKLNGNMPILPGNRIHYEDIFLNIIENAVVFNDKPLCRIEINHIDNGLNNIYEIKDNGPGISSKYHEKVFGMFQTLDIAGVSDTTGMGLAIVKKIIEIENGSISIDSESGSGTKIIISLPKKITRDQVEQNISS